MTSKHRDTPTTQEPRWLTIAECAQEARVCRRTVDRWIAENLVRSTRPVASGSGRRLVDAASFRAFLSGAPAVEV